MLHHKSYLLIVAVVLCVTTLVSCIDETLPATLCHDADVVVELNIAPLQTGRQQVLPDPGLDHGEMSCNWRQLVLFFVYAEGDNVVRVVTREAFDAADMHDTHRRIPLTINSGMITEIYAAAFGAEQTYTATSGTLSTEAIKNFRTVSLRNISSTASSDARNSYMQSLLSGIDTNDHEIFTRAELLKNPQGQPHIVITLNRIISKIDVQYDLYEAYESGKFVSATMSAIDFTCLDRGYFFPDSATFDDTSKLDTATGIVRTISERNGRSHFYAFPGKDNSFAFNMKYTSADGELTELNNRYIATFDRALNPAA